MREYPGPSRTAVLFVVIGLALSSIGIAYISYAGRERRLPAVTVPQDDPRIAQLQALVRVLVHSLVLFLVFLFGSYVLVRIARGEGHICVELFTQNLRGRARARLDVFVGLLTLVWVLLIAWYAMEEAITTTADGEIQETGNGFVIVWPGRWFIPAGCAIMGLSVALQLFKDIRNATAPTGR